MYSRSRRGDALDGVGAFPGAAAFYGWTGENEVEGAWVLFAILFLWQFAFYCNAWCTRILRARGCMLRWLAGREHHRTTIVAYTVLLTVRWSNAEGIRRVYLSELS